PILARFYSNLDFVHLPSSSLPLLLFFFNDPATTEIYTLSLHDALPISWAFESLLLAQAVTTLSGTATPASPKAAPNATTSPAPRSEEHTSELQSRFDLVCRLLLEKKKKRTKNRC